ncbi:MAG: DsbE family thiol:disulfide interchange protein [Steroidobacteraceae bacterium]
MTRFLLPVGLFALLVVVLAIGIQRAPQKNIIPSALLGKPAPAFSLPELGAPGVTFDSSAYAGRWWILNVWGTWCVECRAEHDMLLEMRRSGLAPIVGLNWKDDDVEAQRWLAQLGNPYERVPVDAEGRVAIDWGVYGAPETFLIDPQGVVVHRHVGPITAEVWDAEFRSRLPRSDAPPTMPVPDADTSVVEPAPAGAAS